MAWFLWHKVSIKVSAKYAEYLHVFLLNIVIKLLKNTSINKYIIKLVEGKQQLYSSIYTLSLVELEILKAYIKTYLKTWFIQSSKFLAGATILFDKKQDSSLCHFVIYQGFNNLTINHYYLLLLIGKTLD